MSPDPGAYYQRICEPNTPLDQTISDNPRAGAKNSRAQKVQFDVLGRPDPVSLEDPADAVCISAQVHELSVALATQGRYLLLERGT
jgi:hypothetical protein